MREKIEENGVRGGVAGTELQREEKTFFLVNKGQ